MVEEKDLLYINKNVLQEISVSVRLVYKSKEKTNFVTENMLCCSLYKVLSVKSYKKTKFIMFL